ncbi:MAG: hypothetical protein JO110_03635, partial [Acetobacteraceae bacterium]|nr:hypothetical protein [Acetobacteraceae bacterium]
MQALVVQSGAARYMARMSRIAAEHLGLARQFCRSVRSADQRVNAALQEVVRPLHDRVRRKPTWREEQLAGAVWVWKRHMPGAFSLAEPFVLRRKGYLAICAPRIVASHWKSLAWSDDGEERGVSLVILGLALGPARFEANSIPVAAVSIHALARR